MPSPTDPVSLYVTAPDRDTAVTIAKTALAEGLVACANVLPGAVSVYRWQGEAHEDEEVVVFLKTDHGHAERARERIAELHPYDVPCVLEFPLTAGYAPYLAWLGEQLDDRTELGT